MSWGIQTQKPWGFSPGAPGGLSPGVPGGPVLCRGDSALQPRVSHISGGSSLVSVQSCSPELFSPMSWSPWGSLPEPQGDNSVSQGPQSQSPGRLSPSPGGFSPGVPQPPSPAQPCPGGPTSLSRRLRPVSRPVPPLSLRSSRHPVDLRRVPILRCVTPGPARAASIARCGLSRPRSGPALPQLRLSSTSTPPQVCLSSTSTPPQLRPSSASAPPCAASPVRRGRGDTAALGERLGRGGGSGAGLEKPQRGSGPELRPWGGGSPSWADPGG